MSDDVALFAGDVRDRLARGRRDGIEPARPPRCSAWGRSGLCAVQAAYARGAERVIAVDTVAERLEMAGSFGAEPVHLTEEDPRAAVKAVTEGRGVDATIDAVGHPDALELACRLTRKAGTVSATAFTPSGSSCTWESSGSRR